MRDTIQGALALASVVAVDLALARITGGPCSLSMIVPAVLELVVVGLALGLVARRGPVAATLAATGPGVAHGSWACAQALDGRAVWAPLVVALALLVGYRAVRQARAGGRPWGPRHAVAIYGAYVALGWLVMLSDGL